MKYEYDTNLQGGECSEPCGPFGECFKQCIWISGTHIIQCVWIPTGGIPDCTESESNWYSQECGDCYC